MIYDLWAEIWTLSTSKQSNVMQCNSYSYLYDFIIDPNNSEIIQEGRERKLQSMNGKW